MIVCRKCRSEARIPGQRWGRACFAAYMRAYRGVKQKRTQGAEG